MSIIYSYPEQTTLNPNDMLIGTSAIKVGGKQKNITRNFTLQEIANFIGEGGSVFNPTASDFQIGVFNQGGTKLTGSIMSQDAFPNGTSITVSGNLTATGNLTVSGGAVVGNGVDSIIFQSPTYLQGPIFDSRPVIGADNQILISNANGLGVWTDYQAGLTYAGVWNASNNTTNGLSNSPALTNSNGTNGQFYIITVGGNTQLNGQPPAPTTPAYWQPGDWVVRVESGAVDAWQKIDNTSALVGQGTPNTLSKWDTATTLGDSLISQDAGATAVTVAGALTSTGNISGVNITGTGNLSGDNLLLTGTVSLNTQLGSSGQVLTSQGTADAIWANPNPINNIIGSGTANTLSMFTSQYAVGNSIVTQDAGGTIVTTAGNSSITGYIQPATLLDAGASPGTAGQVLTSTITALDWVDASTIGDNYELGSGSTVVADSIELQLTSGSGTDNSAITLTGGTGITVAQTSNVVTLTSTAAGETYTLQSASTPGANRVPIDLTAASGAAASSILNLVEGTGITLAQTSATEITISGSAQGITGSGTVNKLPKFNTTTSLTDSLISETVSATSNSFTLSNSTSVGTINFQKTTSSGAGPTYTMVNVSPVDLSVDPNAGPGNWNFIRWNFNTTQEADNFRTLYSLPTPGASCTTGGASTLAQDTNFTITFNNGSTVTVTATAGQMAYNCGDSVGIGYYGEGVGTGFAGVGFQWVSGSGSISTGNTTTAGAINMSEIVDMTTHKIINVQDPTLAQDAATKQYVDTSVVGGLIYQGGYDASNNNPALDDRATQVAVSKGWTYTVTADGTFYTETVKIGDVLIAEVDIAAGTGALTDWTTVQSNIDVATATVQGIANFPTGNNQLNIATGSVTAKTFGDGNLGTSTTGGYVPDATSAAAGTFLKKDGTWSVAGAGTVTGTGTQYKVPLWSNVAGTALGNSLFTQDPSATKVTLDGLLEVLGDGSSQDGRIKLNCYQNTHGVTIQSPPHIDNATYTLILPSTLTNTTGQVLTSGGSSAGAQLSWTALPAGYTSWSASSDQNTNIAITDGTVLDFSGRLASDGAYGSGLSLGAGIYTDTAINTGEVTTGLIINGGTPDATTFYRGDGQWATPTGASATITTRSYTGNAATSLFALGATPSGGAKNMTNIFFDGVYQDIDTYSIAGAYVTFSSPPALGVGIETNTISGFNVLAAVESVNGEIGSVLLSNPSYVTSNSTASNGGLYIFDSTTQGYTLTLPPSPSISDSIKISIRGGLATNALNPGSTNKIMGATGSMTIDNATAAFEIIWAAGSQGWIIIGNV